MQKDDNCAKFRSWKPIAIEPLRPCLPGLQVVRQPHDHDGGEDGEAAEEVRYPGPGEVERPARVRLREVAEVVEHEGGPEEQAGRHHDVALGALHAVVQLEHVVQHRARVGPRQVRAKLVLREEGGVGGLGE